MTQALSLNEFKNLAKEARRIAVFRVFPIGNLTPVQTYRALSRVYGENGAIFENLGIEESRPCSYLCFDPRVTFKMHHNDKQDPFLQLRNLQAEYSFATRESVKSLINAAMGFITYDIVRYIENIPDNHPADPRLPLLLFHFYALSLCFDHHHQNLLISIVVELGDDLEADYRLAEQNIEETMQVLIKNLHIPEEPSQDISREPIEVDISDLQFIEKVKKAKEHIIAGDAFQIVLSRCFKSRYTASPLDIYTTLCRVSRAPFMFYLPIEQAAIVGASPERMIAVMDKKITVNPIAGTRKRGPENTDASIAADLLSDEKELAEHMMLIDLARNDVGAVSVPGTVVVSEMLRVKHYSHVSHITSSVTGQLQEKYDAWDAFAKAFPAGTLSGAPKIRAMEIIDSLETSRRGLYGGAICRMDAKGNLDSCIAIRTALLRDGVALIRVGAGIVYDSQPQSEADETRHKAESMLVALRSDPLSPSAPAPLPQGRDEQIEVKE